MWYEHLSHSPEDARNFVVLRISTDVLDLDGCIISQWRTALKPQFLSRSQADHLVDLDVIFGRRFVDPKQFKLQKSTQVSIPYGIPAKFIIGAYVAKSFLLDQVKKTAPQLNNIQADRKLFFVDKLLGVQKALIESERNRAVTSSNLELVSDDPADIKSQNTWSEHEYEIWASTDPRYTSDEFWDDDAEDDLDA